MKAPVTESIRKILIITLSNVGDVAVSTPVLVALKERYPRAQLQVLVGPKAKDVVASSAELDRVLINDKKISWKKKWELALELRRERFDLVIDLRNTAFPFITGARYRTSLIRWGEGRKSSMRERHFKRLRFLGITDLPERSFDLITAAEKESATKILQASGIARGEAFICLAPGARDSKKRWSAESFGELGKRLSDKFKIKVLLLGSPDEKDILGVAQRASGGRLIPLLQQTSFREVIGIVSASRLFCGNDSGLLHIAHEMKVPSVGVFGPTNPVESGYCDARSRTAFPLMKDPRDPRGGLDSLSVDKVYGLCAELLNNRHASSVMKTAQLSDIALPPNPKILVTRIDRIGDVVLTTPVFQVLKENYPGARLSVIVSPQTREIVEGNPYVDEVLVYDKKGTEKGAWGTWRFAWKLRMKKFNACIHFHATNRVFWLSFLAGIPVRIGHRRKLHSLLTHPIEERKRQGLKHESEYNLELLGVLGLACAQVPPPHFPLDEKDRLSLLRKFPQIKGMSYFVMGPSASCPSRRWPADRFKTVAEVLHHTKGLLPIIIGSGEDHEISRQVMTGIRTEAYDLTGRLTLRELAWLLKGAKLFISNDTGPAHIAGALGVPVIAFFGRPEPGLSPVRWRPLGDRSFFIDKTRVASEITSDWSKPSEGLLSLMPEEVVELAERLI